MKVVLFLFSLNLIWLGAGCQRKPLEFAEHEKTAALMPEVRTAVKQHLHDLYGGVKTPRAPHWLPIDRGGIEVEISSVPEQAPQQGFRELVLTEFSTEVDPASVKTVEPILDPRELSRRQNQENLASLATSSSEVQEFDAANSRLLLTELLKVPLETGDYVMLNANSKLLRGYNLYQQHCMMCHGVTGLGDGPQSQVLNPRPRDFRLGILKYTSTKAGVKPSTADLKNVIKSGIAGTGMPAFMLLGNQEVAAIAEYVKYLSLRGETEQQLSSEVEIDFGQEVWNERLQKAASANNSQQETQKLQAELQIFLEEELPEIALVIAESIGENWALGDDPFETVMPGIARPEPTGKSLANPELTSLENGKRLYLSKDLQCAACHGQTGKGDGEQTKQFHKKPDGSLYKTPGLHDQWGQYLKPRDLTYGVFHGGRQPLDLFRRIHAGVKGTPMPAYGQRGMSDAEIWDLVNHLYFLTGDIPPVSADTP